MLHPTRRAVPDPTLPLRSAPEPQPAGKRIALALLILCGSMLTAQERQGQRRLQGRGPSLQVVEADEHDRELRMTPAVQVVQKTADSVVSIYIGVQLEADNAMPEGQGSGVILDESGFVITNWHVIAAAQANRGYEVLVRLKDGRSRPARILSSSPEHDLALLQMQLEKDESVQPVEIGRSADLMIGEDVIAIGNPQGHANTVTRGVLSAIGRTIQVRDPRGARRTYSNLLQTDAAINQGNSGGALFDVTGRLIGINNAMAMGAENIGFAIPVDTVREVFENELTSSERFLAAADSPWLGLTLADDEGRLMVRAVVDGGPAADAGIRAGDRIVQVGDAELHTRIDFDRRIVTAKVGQAFPLLLERSGRRLQLSPVPLARASAPILLMTGVHIEEVSAGRDRQLAERVTRKFYQGERMFRLPLYPAVLRVKDVAEDSPAAALEIQPGDVLMAVVLPDRFGRDRDVRLDDAADFANLLRKRQGDSVRVVVLRGDDDLVGTLDDRRVDG